MSDKVKPLSKSLALLDLDTWKKVKVDGAEVSPVRVATHALPKPAQLGPTVEGYSCVGTEVRGTLGRRRVEYFIYTMDNHRDCYEKYGYSLTLVQTGIPPALTALLLIERGADPDVPDVQGNLPLHGAADSGHAEVVALLLKRTRDPAARNLEGKTARDLARQRGYEEIGREHPGERA